MASFNNNFIQNNIDNINTIINNLGNTSVNNVFDTSNFYPLFSKTDRIMVLKLFVDGNDELKNAYRNAVRDHNERIFINPYIDAGFDVLNPFASVATGGQVNKINFMVKCEATMVTDADKSFPTGFYMYPRSSLSKTPLRLANSVGIIDSGYRGNLIGAFDCSGSSFQTVEHDRYVQICAPTLCPIFVIMVDNENQMEETMRGAGGFGSTGR
jgi:dUTP pyrophosphatase